MNLLKNFFNFYLYIFSWWISFRLNLNVFCSFCVIKAFKSIIHAQHFDEFSQKAFFYLPSSREWNRFFIALKISSTFSSTHITLESIFYSSWHRSFLSQCSDNCFSLTSAYDHGWKRDCTLYDMLTRDCEKRKDKL